MLILLLYRKRILEELSSQKTKVSQQFYQWIAPRDSITIKLWYQSNGVYKFDYYRQLRWWSSTAFYWSPAAPRLHASDPRHNLGCSLLNRQAISKCNWARSVQVADCRLRNIAAIQSVRTESMRCLVVALMIAQLMCYERPPRFQWTCQYRHHYLFDNEGSSSADQQTICNVNATTSNINYITMRSDIALLSIMWLLKYTYLYGSWQIFYHHHQSPHSHIF